MRLLTKKIENPYLISALLILINLVAYTQVLDFEFVDYDDPLYVGNNPAVTAGLTVRGLEWAFTTGHGANWHPLTWLSHMLDVELFGLNPSGHHLTNLVFHIANSLLLFHVLRRMTKATWQSAFVAALFAIHPLHVESVAWIAERKDVLSTFFWMLTLLAYVGYVEKKSLGRYVLVAVTLALGLMSKAMLVTIPFVLLLLDYWPLGRFNPPANERGAKQKGAKSLRPAYFRSALVRLVKEKLPLFAIVAASSVITYLVQQSGGAVQTLEKYPLSIRLANAGVSYLGYIFKTVWPADLAVFYPFETYWSVLKVAGVVFLLAIATWIVIRMLRRFRYLTVGWLWYLGTLVPVIGIVQVGAQSMADRYTYIPLIGIFLMVAWGIPDLLKPFRQRLTVLVPAALAVLITLTAVTQSQVRHWKNSGTLFERAVTVVENNYIAHYNFGNFLNEKGRAEEALKHYSEAVRIRPNYVDARYNLGIALFKSGRTREAIAHYSEAVRYKPNHWQALYNIGLAYHVLGQLNDAVVHYNRSLQFNPNYPDTHYNLAVAYHNLGQIKNAITHYEATLRLKPDHSAARGNLNSALAAQQQAGSQ